MQNKSFSRNCPTCNKLITYSSKSSLTRSADRPCQSCFITAQWAKEDSPLRAEKTRLKRNSSISQRRQDPNSKYNSKEYRKKQSIAKKLIRTSLSSYTSDEYKQKQSDALKRVWKTEEYRSKRLSKETLLSISNKMKKIWEERGSEFINSFRKSWENTDRREVARLRFIKFLESEEFRRKLWGTNKIIRVSKLELKIKNQLKKLGFVHSSEHKKYFSRYLPDFINEESKTIIEINGDYWHCNPNLEKLYSHSDFYHTRLKMCSSDKWLLDSIRTKFLEEQGYRVIILWENDIEKYCYNIIDLLNKQK